MKPCLALVVLVHCSSSSTTNFLGYPGLGYSTLVSPALLPPRTALDVLPISLSTYPGSSSFFSQFPGLAALPSHRGFFSLPWAKGALTSPPQIVSPAIQTVPQLLEAVDVAEEEKEFGAPIVTIAHEIDAIPFPPVSPFRVELPNIPAGIGAQSTQPIFTQSLFKNPKFGHHGLFVHNSKASPVLREIQAASAGKTRVVQQF